VIIIKGSPQQFFTSSRKIPAGAFLFKLGGGGGQLRFQAAWGIFSCSDAREKSDNI
jgi:hypothetical protein